MMLEARGYVNAPQVYRAWIQHGLLLILAVGVAGCVTSHKQAGNSQDRSSVVFLQGKAYGPYATATRTQGLVFVSGQIGIDPQTGEFGDIRAQTRQALINLQDALQLANGNPEEIVKVTVYLANPSDMKAMNEVYAEFFPKAHYPARTTVPGADWGGTVLIEIDAIAVKLKL